MSDDSTSVGEKARDEDSADSGAKVDVKRDATGRTSTEEDASPRTSALRTTTSQNYPRDDLDFDDLETNTLFYHLNTCTDSSSLRKFFDTGCGSEAARSWAYK